MYVCMYVHIPFDMSRTACLVYAVRRKNFCQKLLSESLFSVKEALVIGYCSFSAVSKTSVIFSKTVS